MTSYDHKCTRCGTVKIRVSPCYNTNYVCRACWDREIAEQDARTKGLVMAAYSAGIKTQREFPDFSTWFQLEEE